MPNPKAFLKGCNLRTLAADLQSEVRLPVDRRAILTAMGDSGNPAFEPVLIEYVVLHLQAARDQPGSYNENNLDSSFAALGKIGSQHATDCLASLLAGGGLKLNNQRSARNAIKSIAQRMETTATVPAHVGRASEPQGLGSPQPPSFPGKTPVDAIDARASGAMAGVSSKSTIDNRQGMFRRREEKRRGPLGIPMGGTIFEEQAGTLVEREETQSTRRWLIGFSVVVVVTAVVAFAVWDKYFRHTQAAPQSGNAPASGTSAQPPNPAGSSDSTGQSATSGAPPPTAAAGSSSPTAPASSNDRLAVPEPIRVPLTLHLTCPSGDTAGTSQSLAIELTNNERSATKNISIRARLGPNLQFVSASNGGSLMGSEVVWIVKQLEAGAAASCSVAVTSPNVGKSMIELSASNEAGHKLSDRCDLQFVKRQ